MLTAENLSTAEISFSLWISW